MKKVWDKPKLVVLVRAKPEEAVLVSCKTETAWVTGDIEREKCYLKTAATCDGGACSDIQTT